MHRAAAAPEDVLGRRIAAALIDAALLAGLFIILVAGQSSNPLASSSLGVVGFTWGGPRLNLSAAWVLYLAVVFLYFFALETAIGQTVGKRLLGLRVVGPDGARPKAGVIAGRTLIRCVDWLPVMYLAGFITMMATGARRQRLGDLAAGTAVTRAVPTRHRALALVPLAVVLLAAVGLSVYRGTSAARTLTYRAHGVSFDYPAAWGHGSISVHSGGTGELWHTGIGIAPSDLIRVAAVPLNSPVTAQNISAIMPDLEHRLRRAIEQARDVLEAGPKKIMMGGLPGVEVRTKGRSFTGTSVVVSRRIYAFDGTILYLVLCQHTWANAAEVERACDQVVRTFKVTKPTTVVDESAGPNATARTASPTASSPHLSAT